MATVIICDDEAGLRLVLKRYAENEGYEVIEAENGQEVLDYLQKHEADVLLLDVMMPVLDGFATLKALREFSMIPVIMLSARGEEYDKVLGFELGVDDYVVKPFSSKEMMLRIQALLRRTQAKREPEVASELICSGGLCVDLRAYKVSIEGQAIDVAPKIFELLTLLLQNRHIVVTREQILTTIWGYEYDGDDRTLDTHMKLLRRALGDYGRLITTVRGVGYRFDG